EASRHDGNDCCGNPAHRKSRTPIPEKHTICVHHGKVTATRDVTPVTVPDNSAHLPAWQLHERSARHEHRNRHPERGCVLAAGRTAAGCGLAGSCDGKTVLA